MYLCQDEAEIIHTGTSGDGTNAWPQMKGGGIFYQWPFFDFQYTLQDIFFLSLAYYVYRTLITVNTYK